MPNDTKRGIGAVMIAMATVGLLVWLAIVRLSSDLALGPVGLVVLTADVAAIALGIWLIRKNR